MSETHLSNTVQDRSAMSLRISQVKLNNYRCFDEIEFSPLNGADNHVTVLIGNNGAGKTAILDAIAANLSWLVARIKSPKGQGKGLEQQDINRHGENNFAASGLTFCLDNSNSYTMSSVKTSVGQLTRQESQYKAIQQLASLFRQFHSQDEAYPLPLIAYYSVERGQDVTIKNVTGRTEIGSMLFDKFAGYVDCLNQHNRFKHFFQWFKDCEDLANEGNGQVDSEQMLLELRQQLLDETKDNDIKAMIADFRERYVKDNEQSQAQKKVRQKAQQLIKVVQAVVQCFMPELSHLRVQRSPYLSLVVNKSGKTIDVALMSQGEKSLLALVADIARRLSLLNPSSTDPLKGDGIVLIDEIDLHLHPSWQQSIMQNLQQCFPNVQFIVTTHSPQVLTTVKHQSILQLEDQKIKSTCIPTIGEASNVTLEDIMGVNARPKDPMSDELKRYLQLVNRGDIEGQEFDELQRTLRAHYGEQNSQMRLAQMVMNQRKAMQLANGA